MRAMGAFLPDRLRLVDDPYGLRFAQGARVLESRRATRLARTTARFWMKGYVRRFAVYMQLRTRAIDDDVARFVQQGGRQVVLLGAGFDCRAWRLAALAGATVYEVDHPATQYKKRSIMAGEQAGARLTFVPWDFEREPLAALPARLSREGHDAGAPTMTILEGVVMYLSAPALDATFECIAEYSSPGSPLAMTYLEPTIAGGWKAQFASNRIAVRLMGEPFRSAFSPAQLPGWLAARRFRLERDESAAQVGSRLLSLDPSRMGARASLSHFALARRASDMRR
jgi:methyltransferase (TIGR00027 family)